MADDPHVREIGRVAGSHGGTVIVGVDYDTVTLQTDGAALGTRQVEELAQLIVSATWQSAMCLGNEQGQLEAAAAAGTAPGDAR